MAEAKDTAASGNIDAYIAGLNDWRGGHIARVRETALAAGLEENWKWNCPVWSAKGDILSAGAFRTHAKINFFRGAELADPDQLFNAGLDAKKSRSIDLHERAELDLAALDALIQAAKQLDSR